jgi:transposase
VLRGKDVHEVEQMKQMGLSVSAISELTGYDRKTVRKYLLNPEGVPDYGPREAQPSKLDPHKPYLADRLRRACGTRKCCCGRSASAAMVAATRS